MEHKRKGVKLTTKMLLLINLPILVIAVIAVLIGAVKQKNLAEDITKEQMQ